MSYTDWVSRNQGAVRTVILLVVGANIMGYLVTACMRSERQELAERGTRYAKENRAMALKLPDGCELRYIGDWQRVNVANIPVVVAYCPGRTTISNNSIVRDGKTDKPSTSIVIEDHPEEIK